MFEGLAGVWWKWAAKKKRPGWAGEVCQCRSQPPPEDGGNATPRRGAAAQPQ